MIRLSSLWRSSTRDHRLTILGHHLNKLVSKCLNRLNHSEKARFLTQLCHFAPPLKGARRRGKKMEELRFQFFKYQGIRLGRVQERMLPGQVSQVKTFWYSTRLYLFVGVWEVDRCVAHQGIQPAGCFVEDSKLAILSLLFCFAFLSSCFCVRFLVPLPHASFHVAISCLAPQETKALAECSSIEMFARTVSPPATEPISPDAKLELPNVNWQTGRYCSQQGRDGARDSCPDKVLSGCHWHWMDAQGHTCQHHSTSNPIWSFSVNGISSGKLFSLATFSACQVAVPLRAAKNNRKDRKSLDHSPWQNHGMPWWLASSCTHEDYHCFVAFHWRFDLDFLKGSSTQAEAFIMLCKWFTKSPTSLESLVSPRPKPLAALCQLFRSCKSKSSSLAKQRLWNVQSTPSIFCNFYTLNKWVLKMLPWWWQSSWRAAIQTEHVNSTWTLAKLEAVPLVPRKDRQSFVHFKHCRVNIWLVYLFGPRNTAELLNY